MASFVGSFDLLFLKDAATLVDSRLRALEHEAKRSDDPDRDGIYERGEYISGFGLVACQTYMSACIAHSKLDKVTALSLGPSHGCGASMANLIDALANYWKHSAEWTSPPSPIAQRTIATLSKLGLDTRASYFTTNALAALLRPHEPRIKRVIPFLRQWNDSVQAAP